MMMKDSMDSPSFCQYYHPAGIPGGYLGLAIAQLTMRRLQASHNDREIKEP